MTNNNDLISREALKEDLRQYFTKGDALYQILTIIDNAPSVFSCNACKNMGNEWECVDCHDYSNYVHYEERTQGEPVIKCQDCKYQVKEWREDKRMKDKGYWVYGCEHFGEIMGYWGFGGNDNEFCSDAEQKGGVK